MDEVSIIRTIREMLGADECFNTEIIVHINSVFSILARLGLPGDTGFPYRITGEDETWSDYLGYREDLFSDVKSFIYIRVKLVFDPPVSTVAMEALKETAKELEWTINHACEIESINMNVTTGE